MSSASVVGWRRRGERVVGIGELIKRNVHGPTLGRECEIAAFSCRPGSAARFFQLSLILSPPPFPRPSRCCASRNNPVPRLLFPRSSTRRANLSTARKCSFARPRRVFPYSAIFAVDLHRPAIEEGAAIGARFVWTELFCIGCSNIELLSKIRCDFRKFLEIKLVL